MLTMEDEIPLGVSEFLLLVKSTLGSAFSEVTLYGEISRLTTSAGGHSYFQLIDKESSLPCCVFKPQAAMLKKLGPLQDGTLLQVEGQVSFYHQRAQVQIIVKNLVVIDKVGLLKKKFQQLYLKLQAEGLFNPLEKKIPPFFLYRVAIITAEGGAALQDFLKIFTTLSYYQVDIYPSIMQGEKAAKLIMEQLKKVYERHQLSPYDALVVTRGGGSYEDLWCFNDEELVRVLKRAPMFTISAIGHEIDHTLLDEVADVRSPTPSHSAQFLKNIQEQVIARIDVQLDKLKNFKNQQLKYLKQFQLSFRSQFFYLLTKQKSQKINYELKSLASRLLAFRKVVSTWDQQKATLLGQQAKNLKQKLSTLQKHLDHQMQLISVLSPQAVLKRGFSLVTLGDKVLGTSKEFLEISTNEHNKEKIEIQFQDQKIKIYKK